jgi:putative zinc finger/helix-turn-helix YgiT family protein
MTERAFSKKCGKCRQRAVALATVPYTIQVDHDGRKYEVTLPDLVVPRCGNCGTIAFDEEADRQISAAFRKQAGLLSPEQIRQHRLALGLTQQELADLLDVGVSTLSRWETGAQVQQRSLDRFLRATFLLPELRRALADGEALQLPEVSEVETCGTAAAVNRPLADQSAESPEENGARSSSRAGR